jgi:hypothetical protein
MKPAHTSPERLDGLSLDRRHRFEQQKIMLFFLMAANQIQRMRICEPNFGGADRDRTGDLMLAKHALSQLSYSPTSKDGGPG